MKRLLALILTLLLAGPALADPPAAWDWRDHDGVTAVRDQGACSACWAFSATAALESQIKIHTGQEVDLSEQWLISCNTDSYICTWGWFDALDYYVAGGDVGSCGHTGAIFESEFPYTGDDEAACTCPTTHHFWLKSWAYIVDDSHVPTVAQIKTAVQTYGPVVAGVFSNAAFANYSGGIFDGCATPDPGINHQVLIVGWDDAQGESGVWIIKNSHGTGWGEAGYMRIPYGCSDIGYGAAYLILDDDYYVSKGSATAATNGGGPLDRIGANDGPLYTLTAKCTSNGDGTDLQDTNAATWGTTAVGDHVCFNDADYTTVTAHPSAAHITVSPAVTASQANKNCKVGGYWALPSTAVAAMPTGSTCHIFAGSYADALSFSTNQSGKTLSFARQGSGTVTLAKQTTSGNEALEFKNLAASTIIAMSDIVVSPAAGSYDQTTVNIEATAQLTLLLTRCDFYDLSTCTKALFTCAAKTSSPVRVITATDCNFYQQGNDAAAGATKVLSCTDVSSFSGSGCLFSQATQTQATDCVYFKITNTDMTLTLDTCTFDSASHGLVMSGKATNGIPTKFFTLRARDCDFGDDTVGALERVSPTYTMTNQTGWRAIDVQRCTARVDSHETFAFFGDYLGVVVFRDNTCTQGPNSTGYPSVAFGQEWDSNSAYVLPFSTADITGNTFIAEASAAANTYEQLGLGRVLCGGQVAYNRFSLARGTCVTVKGCRGVALHHNTFDGPVGAALSGSLQGVTLFNNTFRSFEGSYDLTNWACIDHVRTVVAQTVADLSARGGDTTGTLSVANYDADRTPGVQAGNYVDLTWSGGSRSDCLVSNVTAQTFDVSGGTGDNLPAEETQITTVTAFATQRGFAVFDNIFLVAGTGGYVYRDRSNVPSGEYAHGSMRWEGNVYWPTDGAKIASLQGSDYTAAQWAQYVAGLAALPADADGAVVPLANEATGLLADPRFVNAAGGDFRLLPSSPCIDRPTGTSPTGSRRLNAIGATGYYSTGGFWIPGGWVGW
jgi:hypothetical protein